MSANMAPICIVSAILLSSCKNPLCQGNKRRNTARASALEVTPSFFIARNHSI